MKVKSIVAAFNIDTTYTSFAIAYINNPEYIYVQDKWEGGCYMNTKTLTQIVLNEDRKCVAFGYEARDYLKNHDVDPDSNLHFAFYIMRLFDEKNRAQSVRAMNSSETATAQQLITETLRYLKKRVMAEINDSSEFNFYENEIQWVITIPTIWGDSCKQVIRNCADDAGLCSKHDEESLIFSYEPEAGALQCIYEKNSGNTVEIGSKFMVIDNGGSTSDMIIYEQMIDKKLNSISRSFGGDYGSTYVNANFIKFLENLFGKDEIVKVLDSSQFQLLLDAFELNKKSFGVGNIDETSNRILDFDPISLFKKDVAWLTDKIKKYNERTKSSIGYSNAREKLLLPFGVFKSFFQPLFNSITDSIKNEMKSNPGISKLDYIFLIGEFNENKFLQEHIKRELEFTGARFIIPKHPSIAVIMGAARFGLNPNTISKRYQIRSYATEIQEEVKPGKHVGKQLIKRGNVSYCPNVCDVFVNAGQMVGYNESITRSYMPTSVGQKLIEIPIFSSRMPTMSYTTDPGVQFIGELCIVIPNPGLPVTDNRIDVSMEFGSTEIKVIVTHFKTGREISHLFDFVIDEAESIRRHKLYQEKSVIIKNANSFTKY